MSQALQRLAAAAEPADEHWGGSSLKARTKLGWVVFLQPGRIYVAIDT